MGVVKVAKKAGGLVKDLAGGTLFKNRAKKRRRAKVVKMFAFAFVGWIIMSTMLVNRGCNLVQEYFDY